MNFGQRHGQRHGRRDVLRAGVLLLPLAAAVSCTEPEQPPPPDPLVDLAARARSDAATAAAVVKAVPALAGPAQQVADARGEHATALQKEVDRARPPVSSTKAAPPSATKPPAGAAGARKALLDALSAAEQEAAKLVPSVERYRAGLVGSVAASCASLREVFA
jgi:hypothetical protein